MRNGNRRRVEELTLQGWSATQIGRELGISPSTVYVHRHAARKRSREPLIRSVNVAHSVARDQLQNHSPGQADDLVALSDGWLSAKGEITCRNQARQQLKCPRSTNREQTMPRTIQQRTLDIIEMHRQGMRPIHIAEKLGTTQPIVNAAIKTGRRNGMLPTRKPTAMHRQTMLRKYGLRLGSISEIHGGLTRDQLVVLAGKAADVGVDTLAEYILEITRDYLFEQEAKKTNG